MMNAFKRRWLIAQDVALFETYVEGRGFLFARCILHWIIGTRLIYTTDTQTTRYEKSS